MPSSPLAHAAPRSSSLPSADRGGKPSGRLPTPGQWRSALPRSWLLACLSSALPAHLLYARWSTPPDAALYLRYFAPLLPPVLMLGLWGVCLAVMESRGTRVLACWSPEDARTVPAGRAILRAACAAGVLVSATGALFLYLLAAGARGAAAAVPPATYALLACALFVPGAWGAGPGRRALGRTLLRVVLPLRAVSWSDFLLADVLTSLARPLRDLVRAVLAMAVGGVLGPLPSVCGDASWALAAAAAAPYAWRLAQCLRVWSDTGTRPQLWNALKYSTAFPAIFLVAAQAAAASSPGAGWVSARELGDLAAAAAALNTAYSFYWDVERDWEVGLFSQMRVQRTLAPALHLGAQATYPRAFYRFLLVSNALLRCAWVSRLVPALARPARPNAGAELVLALAALEALRRFQWIFVRVEVELRKIQVARPDLGPVLPGAEPGSPPGHALSSPGHHGAVHTPKSITQLVEGVTGRAASRWS